MSSNKEQKLANLSREIYETSMRRIIPLYPWVLVRMIPKEQSVAGIILPTTQNKPTREGIVIATWEPKYLKSRALGYSGEFVPNVVSEMVLGDRVLFSYAEGMPVPFLDDTGENYRLVREKTTDPKMGVLGKLIYDGDDELRSKLEKIFRGVGSLTLSGV